MPKYDYDCECGKKVKDIEQPMNNQTAVICLFCNKEMKKSFSNIKPAAIFKGSGFYQTDYKNKGVKK